MIKIPVPETGTGNLCKFLERVSCFLVQVFSGIWNLNQIANLCQIFGTNFWNMYQIL